MTLQHFAFGDGMAALATLDKYKRRRQLRLAPTRQFWRSMQDFQRLHGYRLVTYTDFVDGFLARPRTDDMRQMADDVLPQLYR